MDNIDENVDGKDENNVEEREKEKERRQGYLYVRIGLDPPSSQHLIGRAFCEIVNTRSHTF